MHQSSKKYLQQAALADESCISFTRDRLKWSFYFAQGKLLYATNYLENFERLERQLRRLSREVPTLNEKLRSQLRLMFDETENAEVPVEYVALNWLVSEQQLSKSFAIQALVRMMQESLEIFLSLPEGDFSIERDRRSLPGISSSFDLNNVLDLVSKRLQSWQEMGPTLFSPYQCPYLVSQTIAEKRMPADTVQRLGRMLKGFNLRQLGAMLGRDDLAVAKQLLPLVRDGAVLLRDPVSPFDLLPRFYHLAPEKKAETFVEEVVEANNINQDRDFDSMTQSLIKEKAKTWKIACVDDSQAMLNEIERLLDGEEYEVSLINDSLKALMKLASIRPDLILLDVGMPNVDGYQLCTLIRKTHIFKETPVVMVTGHKGLLDRARARMAGATDYLTKPFTRADLLNMVMRHLI